MKFISASFIVLFVFLSLDLSAQKINVLNEKGKKVYTYRAGRDLDFRINYNALYPERQGEFIEARMFSAIDSISGTTMYLRENIIVAAYSKTETQLVEENYEYTELKVDIGDIKSVSFTPMGASIGNSLFAIGLATILASPLLGLTPDGFNTSRFATVAGIGAATAASGFVLKMSFRQKPVKIKEFDGPDYFKSYQSGSFSTTE